VLAEGRGVKEALFTRDERKKPVVGGALEGTRFLRKRGSSTWDKKETGLC